MTITNKNASRDQIAEGVPMQQASVQVAVYHSTERPFVSQKMP
jgi:hypothetical protein